MLLLLRSVVYIQSNLLTGVQPGSKLASITNQHLLCQVGLTAHFTEDISFLISYILKIPSSICSLFKKLNIFIIMDSVFSGRKLNNETGHIKQSTEHAYKCLAKIIELATTGIVIFIADFYMLTLIRYCN